MSKDEIRQRLESAEKQMIGLQDEIQNLKAKLDVCEDVEIPEYPAFDRGEKYCFVDEWYKVLSGKSCGVNHEDFNLFHTKEMAQLYADKCKLIAMMLHCKWYVDRDNEIMFDGFTSNFCLLYDWSDRKWVVGSQNEYEETTVYFSNRESAQKAADWLNRRVKQDG